MRCPACGAIDIAIALLDTGVLALRSPVHAPRSANANQNPLSAASPYRVWEINESVGHCLERVTGVSLTTTVPLRANITTMSDSDSRYRWFRFAAIFTLTLIFTLPLPLYVGVPLSITAAIAVEYPHGTKR